jgi:integrase
MKRSYGTGNLRVRRGAWYGQWHVGGRRVQRKLGAVRQPGTRQGLTKRQAEARLRELIQDVKPAPAGSEQLTVAEAGERYIRHVEHVLERKPTTVADYGSILRRHLAPHFGQAGIDKITTEQIGIYMAAKAREGLKTKTISNHLNFTHGLFGFAVKRGWTETNPVANVDRPRVSGTDPDIRYLARSEIEALLRAVPDDRLGPTDRTLYLTATMAGLRMGELVALRWQDVDWIAGVVRIRRTYTRGQFGTPKSRRSTRAVPVADRLAGELERHFQRSAYQADEDLVFGHPDTGGPYDPSKMRKRFKGALKAAGLRPVRFHDLRHSYGTAMAAAGAPLRALQEWMGHRDYKTTSIYADYSPDPSQGAAWAEAAFGLENNNPADMPEKEEA